MNTPQTNTIKAKAWDTTIPFTAAEEESINVSLRYKGIQAGSRIGLTCTNPGTTPPIVIQPVTVTNPEGVAGVTVLAPAGFTCELTYTLWNPAAATTNQPEGSYVELSVLKPVTDDTAGDVAPVKYTTLAQVTTTN